MVAIEVGGVVEDGGGPKMIGFFRRLLGQWWRSSTLVEIFERGAFEGRRLCGDLRRCQIFRNREVSDMWRSESGEGLRMPLDAFDLRKPPTWWRSQNMAWHKVQHHRELVIACRERKKCLLLWIMCDIWFKSQ